MANVIAVIILVIMVGGAVSYIVKSKKKGVHCIGCGSSGSCPKCSGHCSDDTDK